MTVINKISLKNFRSHNDFELILSPTTTVITGMNGSGKTSILEAIYLSLQGKSFKGTDNDILKKDSLWWSINFEFKNNDKRIVTYNSELLNSRKKIVIDTKTMYRMSPKYKYPVVLFEPEDLRLLHGSPNRRRQFIDNFISQLDPLYSSNLRRYDKALKQRNNLLKQPYMKRDELFIWDVTLSEYGSYIIEKRIAFIEKINSELNSSYKAISENNDIISIHYSNTYIGDIKQRIINDLAASIEKDINYGYTSTGLHRHDVIFQFNNSPALDIASRGEIRSIVLALKFLEVEIIEKITDKKPIILLDDVFSELDDERQKRLFSMKNQVIITSTKLPENIKVDIKNIKL